MTSKSGHVVVIRSKLTLRQWQLVDNEAVEVRVKNFNTIKYIIAHDSEAQAEYYLLKKQCILHIQIYIGFPV
jgi:hypothetical protein